jgi:hypothetical protein
MYDVFISYRWVSPDQEWVRDELFPALQAAGLRPLLDVEDFVPGRDLILEMTRAGQSSRRALCVITPAYFDGNRMVGFEALIARRTDPSGLDSRLIPLLLRNAQLPEWIRGLVPVDWTNARTQAREWRKLLKVLGAPNIDTPPPRPLSEVGKDSDSVASSPRLSEGTRIQDGVAHLVLTNEGQFVGGVEAVRKLTTGILSNDWGGDPQVHHAFQGRLKRDICDLLAHSGLSADQAKKLERLRPQVNWIASSIETICLATKLTFVPAMGRERTWGVPMRTEEALGFLIGLFVESALTPGTGSSNARCQLYLPDRVRDPLCIDVRVSEGEAKTMGESWTKELAPFDDTRWRTWDWPDLVPIWHLRDQFIATRLLPSVVISLVSRLRGTPPHTTIDNAWEHLRQLYPPTKRDPLIPYHWCLALRSERSAKDLAWLTSPPAHRSDLLPALGLR